MKKTNNEPVTVVESRNNKEMPDLLAPYRKPKPSAPPPSDLSKTAWYLRRASCLLLLFQVVFWALVAGSLTAFILMNLIQSMTGLMTAYVSACFASVLSYIVLIRRMELVSLLDIYLNMRLGRAMPARFSEVLKRIRESYPRFSTTRLKVLPEPPPTEESSTEIIL